MKKIRVVHFLKNLGLGGTEKTCQLFLDYLNRDVFDPVLLYCTDGPRLEYFQKMQRERGLTIWQLREENEVQETLEALSTDILHVYRSGYAEFPEPGTDVRVPRFVETNVFGFYDANPAIDRTLYMSKWLQDYSSRGYNLSVRSDINPARFDFVNNPVEKPCTPYSFELADEWHKEGAIIVGRCGRPDNGIYHALNVNAVKQLRDQGYDVRFLVVAPPENMINDLNALEIPYHFIEPTVNRYTLSKFYNSIDILAHARADGETFGVNIAEAMIHGKPVVTHIAEPSVPGMGVFQSQTDLIDNAMNGFVCENNVDDYAQALRILIDSDFLRQEFGVHAREKALEEYEAAVCTAKLEDIYMSLTNG